MSEISVYDIVPTPKLADKLIGTSVGGVIEDVTYNFTLQELLQLFIPNLPANNLQGVLNYGNTATQNINLTGTISTTNLSVLATANILNSNLSGNTRVMAGLFDRTNSSGTAGQFLRSTGTQVEWFTIPTVIPTLQQVLTSGNTADRDIILTANITAVTATASNVVSNTALSVNGVLRDGTAAAGGSNQILSSTGSGVRWVDMPVYNVISPLLYNSVTKTFSIQPANGSQNGYLSSADWINFDGKQDAIVLTTAGTSGAATFVGNTLNIPVYSPDLSGYVPVSRTLTINGVTYDLSANRSWTIDAGVAEVTATAPLSSSGGAYPDISISQSSSSADGYLSSIDWIDFNSKQDGLNGTGLVKSTSGTISYITDNSTNWNTAYNDSIVSAAVTGTATKTLTLNQQDGGTIQASWSDIDTGLTSVGLSMPSAFTVTNSPLTSNGTIGVTGAGTTAQYVRGDGSLATFPTIAAEAQRLVTEVYNRSGATLTKGTVVYVNGGQGNLPTITKAIATGDSTSAQTYGVVQNDITNMNNGYVVVIGSLQNIDTQAYTEGTQLYLSSTVAGAWTSVKQYAPAHLVYVGIVIRSHPTQGVVEIRIQNGFEMDELHNVFAQSPTNNAILQYKTATSLWTSVDGTTSNIAEGTNLYYLDSRARAALSFTAGSGAYNNTTGVITIPTNTNQLTNGASFITLSSLSAASPLSYDNSIGAFSISQSGASTDGYLSSTDWNTFNNKQVAGNYITSLTGEATGTGPGATVVTLNNASVTGKVLTGVNITGGTVLATDTMLTAFGKLQNQINGLVGSTIYQGVWDASTNTPTLTSSVGTNGFYYIVNVAGSTNLNGITDWKIGDWAIFNGGVWQKVDNTESVTSVNGFTGAVSLTTDNIAQGTTNLYFANSLARAAVSLTTTGSSGVATYNNTTGVFNIPNYGSALSGYLPLTGGTLTGGLYINPANTAVVGLEVASDTIRLRSDSTQPFARQLTTTMGSGTLVKMQAAGFGGTYVTDLGFYTSSSSALNTTPNLYLTGGNNRVGINTDVPAHTLDVVGTAGVSGVLTLGSTISNGTFTYTLPGATGTLALVGGAGVGTVTSVAALTLGTTGTDLSSTIANGTTTPVITLNVPTASATNRGALSSADWTTFNSKQATITLTTTSSSGASTFISNTLNVPNYTLEGLGGQPSATNLTSLSGLTFVSTAFVKMTAAGTFALDTTAYGTGSVTSVAALTLGTTGTDLSSTVATGTTTPVITLNVPTASATNRGALSAADWTTFNSKQNALTNPVTGTGTTNTLPKFTGASTIGNSAITEDGTTIILGRATSTLAVATEANSITITQPTFTTNQPVKLLNFNWYDEPWSIGNIRSSSSPSNGLGIFATEVEKYRFTSGGLVLAAGVNLQFGDNPSIRWSSNNLNLKNTDGSIPVIALRANGSNTQAPRLDIYNTADNAVNITLNGAAGSGVFNSSLVSTDYRYTQDGYLTYNTSAAATSTFTLRNNGTTVLGFNTSNQAAFNAGFVGIGTSNPAELLHVYSSGTAGANIRMTDAGVTNADWSILPSTANTTAKFRIYNRTTATECINIFPNGNFLIGGTTDAGFRFDVNGTGRFTSSVQSSSLIVAGSGYFPAKLITLGGAEFSRYNTNIGTTIVNGSQIALSFGTRSNNIDYDNTLNILNGNVGIGTISPGNKLEVDGDIAAPYFSSIYLDYFEGRGQYKKGFSGRNQSTNTARGLHIFSYDNDSNQGINFWTGTNASRNFAAVITNAGNMGVGTDSPAYRLDVNAANSGDGLRVRNGGTSKIIANGDGVLVWGAAADYGALTWDTGFARVNAFGSYDLRMTTSAGGLILLKSAGNVLIGTGTDNGYRLQVAGGASLAGQLNVNAGTGNSAFFYGDAAFDGANRFYITNNASEYGRTNLVLTGRLDVSNDGYSFGNNMRNGIVFNANEGGAQGAIGTSYYSIQLQMVTKGMYIQSKFGNDNGLQGFLLSADNQLRIRNVNSYGDFALQVTGNSYMSGSITASSFFEISDATVKTLITDNYQAKGIESVVAKLYTKNGKEELGYFAQDVQGILPSAVGKGTDGLLSLSYREVHTAKIARLEKELEELKAKLN
jgi:hypothetical protein